MKPESHKKPDTMAVRCQRDAVNLLYANSTGGLLVSWVAGGGIALSFYQHPMLKLKGVWFALFSLVLVLRLADFVYWRQSLRDACFDPRPPLRRFQIGVFFTALLWSIYVPFFINGMSTIELAATLIIISAMAGGASTVLAPNMLLALCYAPALLIPSSLVLLLSGSSYQITLGALGCLFGVVMINTAKKTATFTANAIISHNENIDLLEDKDSMMDTLKTQHEEIKSINNSLEEKIERRTAEIFRLSNLDPLTQLSNRKAFSKVLAAELQNARQQDTTLALLFIDLDGFKAINDTNGHDIGDQILITTAQRLRNLSDGDYDLCRWGGDEFLIGLKNSHGEAALAFARHTIELLSQPIQIGVERFNLGATIGIALYPDHGIHESDLISSADTAMYVQKKQSKSNACIFDNSMREAMLREQMLKDKMAQAIQTQQLYMVYQPIVCGQTGKPLYCEALMRWNCDGEMISPVEFIPISEQHGMIHLMGEWALKTACQAAAQWQSNHQLGISVNVSIAQLMKLDFVERVDSILQSTQLPAEKLYLEVTESIFADNQQTLLEQIKRLQALNIKISIDDFGTGFSSLALLQSLDADVVKIDRSFVVTMDKGGKAIIQATQYIAEQLGYSVVAEGVETAQELKCLCDLNIGAFQGYYFSRPLKQSDLTQWLKNYPAARPC